MRKTVIGEVTSAASSKTIKVMVPRTVKHPLYGKYLKRRTVYHAHDEQGDAKLGDTVELVSCRPIDPVSYRGPLFPTDQEFRPSSTCDTTRRTRAAPILG